jgi:hypothetical protein
MTLKQIEARITKLEAMHRANPFAGMSNEEIERELVARLDRIAADFDGDYGATAAALEASPDPFDREMAGRITRLVERQRQQQEFREWCAAAMAEQAHSHKTAY